MLNYSSDALAQLSSEVEESARYGNMPHGTFVLKEVLRLLHKAVKMEMPENGCVVDSKKTVEMVEVENLHLPFPVVALEYPHSDFRKLNPETNIAPRKRIALCLDYKGDEQDLLPSLFRDFVVDFQKEGAIAVIPIYHWGGKWIPSAYATLMLKGKRGIEGIIIDELFKDVAHSEKVSVAVCPILIEVAHQLAEELGKTTAWQNALRDNNDEVLAASSLMVALSCSNVSIEKRPAPEKLNKKRVKSGKPPLYDYRVVVVDTHSVKKHYLSHDEGDQSRKSPREHLRRGHIRRLGEKRIWVQSAIVGAGGKLKQTYVVK